MIRYPYTKSKEILIINIIYYLKTECYLNEEVQKIVRMTAQGIKEIKHMFMPFYKYFYIKMINIFSEINL